MNGFGKREMIARLWHGRVRTANAERYREFLNERAIPDYGSVSGNEAIYILERELGEETHFVTLTFWRDELSIRQFAGAELTQAKYYSEDADFLLEFEPHVLHYKVVGSSTRGASVKGW
jgi:heme-degrading monooxygenase HmoA